MFETAVDVSGEDLASCADGLHEWVREARLVGATRLARVAHWADLHAPAPGKAGVVPGGDGCPEVTPFAATELGCLLQTTTHSARSLLADALDLRHRHLRCWEAVMRGQVEDFKARQVARATRAAELRLSQALQVDADCVDALTGLPWGRAMTVVEAAIVRADPGGHERRRAEAERERFVAVGRRDTATGLGTLIARSTVADITRVDAMVGRLAELLKQQGDTDELQARRAKAMAILADPARACLLLTDAAAGGTQDSKAAASTQEAVDAASELGRALLAQGATGLARLRPRTVLYLHVGLADLRARAGVVRAEGLGPVELSALRELLGQDTVVVAPVIDYDEQAPVDAYEIPGRLREAVVTRRPFEVFPWGTLPARAADLDHTVPYRPPGEGGPPGRTRPDNLGPLSRGHHNAKTHAGFRLHQPQPGTYLWRTPAGYWYRVDASGSTALGRQTPADVQRHPTVVRSPQEVRLAGLLAG